MRSSDSSQIEEFTWGNGTAGFLCPAWVGFGKAVEPYAHFSRWWTIHVETILSWRAIMVSMCHVFTRTFELANVRRVWRTRQRDWHLHWHQSHQNHVRGSFYGSQDYWIAMPIGCLWRSVLLRKKTTTDDSKLYAMMDQYLSVFLDKHSRWERYWLSLRSFLRGLLIADSSRKYGGQFERFCWWKGCCTF